MNADRRSVRLLIVDDHEVVRVGLRAVFTAAGGYEIVGEAGTVAEAVKLARERTPEMVLMDVRLPDGHGAEACRAIRAESTDVRVVMLTSYADQDAVLASILGGAAGYLLKETPPGRLLAAVQTVAQGGSLLDPAVTGPIMSWVRRQAEADGKTDTLASAGITAQERKVLSLLADGCTNRQIADSLALSERTVKTYVANILRKLHLNRRSQAAAFMARQDPLQLG